MSTDSGLITASCSSGVAYVQAKSRYYADITNPSASQTLYVNFGQQATTSAFCIALQPSTNMPYIYRVEKYNGAIHFCYPGTTDRFSIFEVID